MPLLMFMLATGASAAKTVEPPECLERSYTAAHLATHPRQPVSWLQVARKRGGFQVVARLRSGQEDVLTTADACQRNSRGAWACTGDGPGLKLEPAEKHGADKWLLRLEAGFLTQEQLEAGSVAQEPKDTPVPADVYILAPCTAYTPVVGLGAEEGVPSLHYVLSFTERDVRRKTLDPDAERAGMDNGGGTYRIALRARLVGSRTERDILVDAFVDMQTCFTAEFFDVDVVAFDNGKPVLASELGPVVLPWTEVGNSYQRVRVLDAKSLDEVWSTPMPGGARGGSRPITALADGSILFKHQRSCVRLDRKMTLHHGGAMCAEIKSAPIPEAVEAKLKARYPGPHSVAAVPGSPYLLLIPSEPVC